MTNASPLAGLFASTDTGPIMFQPFPKIARWNREVIVTEKLDGTNAAVGVTEDGQVYAQSRKRLITPRGQDNFGFAAWVTEHADDLRDGLGPGLHFGEWWGQGIGRGYGLDHKRFSLFNTSRWETVAPWGDYRCAQCELCHVVPVLATYETPASLCFDVPLSRLRHRGSLAAPGFVRPEGIVIFHTAANALFKVTLDGDDKPKGVRL